MHINVCTCVHGFQKRVSSVLPILSSIYSLEAGSLPEPGTQIFSAKLEAITAKQASYSHTTWNLLYGYLTSVLMIEQQAFLTAEQ